MVDFSLLQYTGGVVFSTTGDLLLYFSHSMLKMRLKSSNIGGEKDSLPSDTMSIPLHWINDGSKIAGS